MSYVHDDFYVPICDAKIEWMVKDVEKLKQEAGEIKKKSEPPSRGGQADLHR